MQVHVLVVAAGRGVRFGGPTPKQWRDCAGRPLLSHTLAALASAPGLAGICVVIHPDDRELYEAALAGAPSAAALALPPAHGGESRQISVRKGLEALAPLKPDIVLIHDGARPFVSADVIARAVVAAERHGAAVPGLPVTDTIKQIDGDMIVASPDRNTLRAVQTPQAFRYDLILAAHRAAARADMTDDASVAAAAGHPVHVFEGDLANFKVTTMSDLRAADERLSTPLTDVRVGQGFDVHAFAEGDAVWLGGVQIPHTHKLDGHSDADVVLHALCDAIYGALGDGDIGFHFPPSDAQWRGAPSSIFLEHAAARVRSRGGEIGHLDVNLVCEAPRVGPHREAMRARIAEIAGISVDRVGVKATTAEKLGFVGRREGVACMALATVKLPEPRSTA
jgi:2-C-methyl-D-erythritol 4-phosphate cytidylyltransferase/2-C-methyl-D-erythritol 2,4-cyclodiphosphate synthase